MLSVRLTNRTAVSLLFSLLVVEGLVPFVLSLPGILQDGAEDGLKQQDAQVDDKEGIHGPNTGIHLMLNKPLHVDHNIVLILRGNTHFSTAERF